ncbi:MAG: hypothetical protein LUE98_01150 [Tannerellaceae bacterium]|nr:hypothetical protein [Tannerellaceae bacterium]
MELNWLKTMGYAEQKVRHRFKSAPAKKLTLTIVRVMQIPTMLFGWGSIPFLFGEYTLFLPQIYLAVPAGYSFFDVSMHLRNIFVRYIVIFVVFSLLLRIKCFTFA